MTKGNIPALLPEPAQHTIGHLHCPACEALRRAIIRSGEQSKLTFAEVWPLFLEQKRQEIGPSTLQAYNDYYRKLAPFFGNLLLGNIHIGNIVAYRALRQVTAGPGLINHEVNALSQLLDKAGLWADIAKHYKPLRVPKTGPGQALLEEEALHLLQVASKRTKWRVAYLASIVSVNTACGPGELRKLRIRDIDLVDSCISVVDGAKNDYRVRVIPLNQDAAWAMRQLHERALAGGAVKPEHYIFYANGTKANRGPNPDKAQGDWKKAWYSLRKEAGKLYPKLKTVRIYDLRHHALTSLLENPNISERTIIDIAGHVSHKMLERYSHIRMERRRAALDALESLRKPREGLQLVPKQSVH